MGHMSYTQGEAHMLSTYFQGGTFTGPFWIGLATGPFPVDESATLDDIVEVTGTNYARQQVQRDSSTYGWDLVGDTVQSLQVSWNNLDLSTCWTPIDYAFLTLSPSGTDAPNILISAVDLNDSVILEPQRKFRLIYKFRQI